MTEKFIRTSDTTEFSLQAIRLLLLILLSFYSRLQQVDLAYLIKTDATVDGESSCQFLVIQGEEIR